LPALSAIVLLRERRRQLPQPRAGRHFDWTRLSIRGSWMNPNFLRTIPTS